MGFFFQINFHPLIFYLKWSACPGACGISVDNDGHEILNDVMELILNNDAIVVN